MKNKEEAIKVLESLTYCNKAIKKEVPSWLSRSNFYAKKAIVIEYIVKNRIPFGLEVTVDPRKYSQEDNRLLIINIKDGDYNFSFHQIIKNLHPKFYRLLKKLGYNGDEEVEYTKNDDSSFEYDLEIFDKEYRNIIDFISKTKYETSAPLGNAYRFVCNELRGICIMKDTDINNIDVKVLEKIDGVPFMKMPGKDMSLKNIRKKISKGYDREKIIEYIENWYKHN